LTVGCGGTTEHRTIPDDTRQPLYLRIYILNGHRHATGQEAISALTW